MTDTKTPPADVRQSLGAALQAAGEEIEAELGPEADEAADQATAGAGPVEGAEHEDETEEVEASADEGDDEDEGDEGEESGTEEANPFDELTPEQLREIKSNPATAALYRGLMKSYSKRTAERAEAIRAGQQAQQLAAALRSDPENVLRMIASGFGLDITKKEAARAAAAPDTTAELEALFGPEAGRAVGKVFEKLVDARASELVAPLRSGYGRLLGQHEAAAMASEERAFKARHSDLTPEIEAEVVRLGESGEFVPGAAQSPSAYLDALYAVATARMGKRGASEALARRIQRNARDVEPAGTSARSGARPTSKVLPTMSISEALDAADRELSEEEA